jgi:hypothetical protein
LAIEAGVAQRAEGLFVRYRMRGDLARVVVPEPQAPCFTHGLWKTTCFELFVGVEGETAYQEFNFSPSGQWAAYAFTSYRQRRPWVPSLAPEIRLENGHQELLLEAFVPAVDCWPSHAEGKSLCLGLSAVMETSGGDLSYWALHHPLEAPDFHHLGGFVHRILP